MNTRLIISVVLFGAFAACVGVVAGQKDTSPEFRAPNLDVHMTNEDPRITVIDLEYPIDGIKSVEYIDFEKGATLTLHASEK